jgi:hypothetical protein
MIIEQGWLEEVGLSKVILVNSLGIFLWLVYLSDSDNLLGGLNQAPNFVQTLWAGLY